MTSPNLIKNGDFSLGNQGFQTSYSFSSSSIGPGQYSIRSQYPHMNDGVVVDHTTGSGLMMVVDSKTDVDTVVWRQTINVQIGYSYQFDFWSTSVSWNNRPLGINYSPPVLSWAVGQVDGPVTKVGDLAIVDQNLGEWEKFSATWRAPASGNVSVAIISKDYNYWGNDFAIDDLSMVKLDDPPDLDFDPPKISVSASALWGAPIRLIFTLSEASTDFDASDVFLSSGSLSGFTGSGTQYSAIYNPDPATSGTQFVRVHSGVFSDKSGNYNIDGSDRDNTLVLEAGGIPSGVHKLNLDGFLYDLVRQSDGKILAVGRSGVGASSDFVILRFLSGGALDPEFGSSGVVFDDFGSSDWAAAVGIQPDGKLVVAGTSNFDIAVSRYTVDGDRDSGFGNRGRTSVDFEGSVIANRVLFASSGEIFVVGSADAGYGVRPKIAKIDVSGSLQEGFGSGQESFGIAFQNDAVIFPDGKIVAVGPILRGQTATYWDSFLVRYLPNGSLDPSFGNGGSVSVDTGLVNADTVEAICITSSGKYLVAGSFEAPPVRGLSVMQFNPDGTIDTLFGQSGTAKVSIGSNTYATEILMLADGKFLVSGAIDSDVGVMRFLPNGTLDPTFGNNGVTRLDLGGNDVGRRMVAGDNGDFYVGGTSDSDFVLLRFNANGALDSDFPKPAGLSGIAYHWKSHAILEGVSVETRSGQPPTDPQSPIQFKNIKWGVDGEVTADVWVHSQNGTENLQFEFRVEQGKFNSFVTAPVMTGWASNGEAVGQNYTFAGIALSPSASLSNDSVKIGSLSLQAASTGTVSLSLLLGEVGLSRSAPFSLVASRPLAEADGRFTVGELAVGAYTVNASMKVESDADAITSADALAVLKIAVGRNPNADPDNAGPKLAPNLSPYQIMAADVVGTDGLVTSADAIAVLKMAGKDPAALKPEWVFVEETRDFWDETANGGAGAFSLTRKNALWDRNIGVTRTSGDQEINLVGVLKGDVDGSWTPPVGSQDLDSLAPTYFQELSALIGAPLDQWHA